MVKLYYSSQLDVLERILSDIYRTKHTQMNAPKWYLKGFISFTAKLVCCLSSLCVLTMHCLTIEAINRKDKYVPFYYHCLNWHKCFLQNHSLLFISGIEVLIWVDLLSGRFVDSGSVFPFWKSSITWQLFILVVILLEL
jgi:hypothetical protein